MAEPVLSERSESKGRRIHTPRGKDVAPSLAATGSSTISEALIRGRSVLSESGGEGRADVLILLAHVLGRTREWIVAHGDAKICEPDFALFVDFCERRRLGEPVAYITGTAWFYGREFIVDRSVLVPRPETEHLVDEAVEFIRARGGTARVLDVGTGSGAIACSILAETGARVDATDISLEALTIARLNAEHLGVSDRCRFVQSNLAEAVAGERYDVIVANLPYVPTVDLPRAPDPTSFEPRLALDGGGDGLMVYARLLPDVAALLGEGALVLVEAAPPTIERLLERTRAALPGFDVSVGVDYAGLKRYVKARRVP